MYLCTTSVLLYYSLLCVVKLSVAGKRETRVWDGSVLSGPWADVTMKMINYQMPQKMVILTMVNR